MTCESNRNRQLKRNVLGLKKSKQNIIGIMSISFEFKAHNQIFLFQECVCVCVREREGIATYYQGDQRSYSRTMHMKQTAKRTFLIRLLPISFVNHKLKNERIHTHKIYTNICPKYRNQAVLHNYA